MTGGQIGVLLMNATALPLVAFLGNGNDKAGFIYTAIVFSVISCALTLFAFKNIRELDTDKIQQEPRLPMKKELFGNERQLAVDPDGAGKSLF